MSIRLGTTNPSAFRLGNTAVSKLMLGVTEVWSSAFDPLSLSPALWLDASDAATITSAGSPALVSQWRDKSGLNRHVSASTTSPQTGVNTQNGKNIITFADDKYMTHDAGSDVINFKRICFFAVASFDTPNDQFGRLFSARQSATGKFDYEAPNMLGPIRSSTSLVAWGMNGSGTPNITYSPNSITLHKGRFDGSTAYYSLNNGSEASVAATECGLLRYFRVGMECQSTSQPPSAGAGGSLRGRVCEILIFNSTLSVENRQAVEAYLNSKWAIY